MKQLITYRCEISGRTDRSEQVMYGMDITDDPIEWLAENQNQKDERYFIVCSLPITDKQAAKYDGAFKGM